LNINYDSPASIKEFLQEHSLCAQKKFGQNFLIAPNARRILIDALAAPPGCAVWEIGPGLGAMTASLLKNGVHLTAFEVDRGFCKLLCEMFYGKKNFTLIEGDVLKTWKTQQCKAEIILGNLPYNIAATVIAGFIEDGFYFKRGVFTLQKEVAARICAKAGSKDYSSLSVLCSSMYTVTPLSVFKSAVFYPMPNVDSQAVLFERRNDVSASIYPPFFYSLVRTLFANRRKTILNNLCAFINQNNSIVKVPAATSPKIFAENVLSTVNIAPNERAENIVLNDFLKIAQCFSAIP
jgi:16S rRNA (adenine1518-N6/adenine1519-N6)-dimethyltransferase